MESNPKKFREDPRTPLPLYRTGFPLLCAQRERYPLAKTQRRKNQTWELTAPWISHSPKWTKAKFAYHRLANWFFRPKDDYVTNWRSQTKSVTSGSEARPLTHCSKPSLCHLLEGMPWVNLQMHFHKMLLETFRLTLLRTSRRCLNHKEDLRLFVFFVIIEIWRLF